MIDLATSLRRWGRLGLGLFALVLVTTGCDAFIDQDQSDSAPSSPTIAGYVQEVPALSALEGAVAEAGLVETLDTGGPFTVFAPTNDAISPAIDPSLNRQVAGKVVQHHVVNGEATSDQLSDGQTVSPRAGDDLTIGVGENVTVNRATVTNPDANAQNGVVHVVDELLADAVDRATLTPRFTLFARLVKEADLAGALRGPGANDGRTIFAPTNEALLSLLDSNNNGSLENSEIPSGADGILRYHVHDNALTASDFPAADTTISSLQGTDLVINGGDDVTVNPSNEGAGVTIPNVEVDNGVIHGIDAVLTP
ncbi:putative surface protein with fasciclin (FAS1) repeats [Salinibacter ruber]|uniref:fasciclin domain-containing protein n=1 Tax=Salinibacter ruber TaxID=146919 RepID=UPI002168C392|nr:fasciclin domain-containing protein [Salinibacter ruber]MCS3637712.1 putative surface protein with fasciclin (FAS1) repeats [Salinibacter ruber]MCS3671669.1 putative surface protein with fasciclin (FAS1) repeats [Salinibacter ruber]MCS3823890.1 putative surface protein with fasciclin (FAS1) repeats [Salinibacter ruber]MCS4096820.1 putative surface protein with fasciclin (FAS1) repeats [Salinibacter ruber]MCS4148634.1 putative surface protein with fasciclin (FAS1) repeats [Salinibacter ruber